MIGAIWILVFTVVIGIILYIFELRWRKKNKTANFSSEETKINDDSVVYSSNDEESDECCGLHLVCEKDSLSPMSAEILYYDDEELDRFVGREPDSYSAEEIEEFREVLMTMKPSEIAGWARSITQRNINLPSEIRDELFMLIREQRGINSY